MRRMLLIGMVLGIVALFWLGRAAWFGETNITNAQISDAEYQRRLERDKNVPQERVDKAVAEATKIQESIVAIIGEKKPDFVLHRKFLGDSSTVGSRGVTRNELTWRASKTELEIFIYLGLTKSDAPEDFHRSLDQISMGEFFNVPNIGDEAVLVKNFLFNKQATKVGLHFIKGRAQIDVYMTNHKRKTEKNEKELLEIVRRIEPLIVARPNFDD